MTNATPRKRGRKAEEEAVDWIARRDAIREREWAVHEALIEAGHEALAKLRAGGKAVSLADLVRAFGFASELGRLAAGLPSSHPEALAAPVTQTVRPDLEEALKQVYGEPPRDDVRTEDPQ